MSRAPRSSCGGPLASLSYREAFLLIGPTRVSIASPLARGMPHAVAPRKPPARRVRKAVGHGVEAVAAERAASAQTCKRQERSRPKPVQAEGVECIFRAGRKIPATPPQQRRKTVAIELHEPDRQEGQGSGRWRLGRRRAGCPVSPIFVILRGQAHSHIAKASPILHAAKRYGRRSRIKIGSVRPKVRTKDGRATAVSRGAERTKEALRPLAAGECGISSRACYGSFAPLGAEHG